ncbi:hypothetical protein PG994_012012 [Apiospora phragmitis]|uniref:Alpha-ketoglutarate-dependent sulfonate dioxygenase n=1 Tax=Apiospora phragmitis TaxID=2905665 RepID=A0ABR1TUJ5_9PEZI
MSGKRWRKAEGSGMGSDYVPPAYTDYEGPQIDEEMESQLKAAFYNLNLSCDASPTPAVDTCLAHLKLLRAFEELKNRIGLTDGLWDIWDSRAQKANRGGPGRSNDTLDILVKLREKRWAVYVARAVDRYEAWWKSFVPVMLTESDMMADGKDGQLSRFESFTSKREPMIWTSSSLPPLDVLLVWHCHMLSPRTFLEDCLRWGYSHLWHSGMPWTEINAALRPNFEYEVTEECKESWHDRTGLAWSNRDDPDIKPLRCPVCFDWDTYPWTTCGLPRDYKGDKKPGLVGSGIGDGQLKSECARCGITIDEDLLRVAKFRDDVENLVTHDWPMAGTILDVRDGLVRKQQKDPDQLFPNRLVRRGLLVDVTNIFQPGNKVKPSMSVIRDRIEKITSHTSLRHSSDLLKKIDKNIDGVGTLAPHRLSKQARMQTRCMMSRYWENSSIFGIDLRGAVMRQGVFTEKMYKIDWLHSPTARFTMEKLVVKYERFFDIAAKFPDEFVTPTLEVDLAWHTHQLSPSQYFDYSVAKTMIFIDHNDKVDEEKLAESFDWMVKTYQQKYGEVYSECFCWFCESLRFKHASSMKKLSPDWRVAVQEGNGESVHISSHPAVQAENEHNPGRRTRRLVFHNDVDDAYSKALKKTNQGPKKALFGRTKSGSSSSSSSTTIMGPRGEDHCDHWGKSIALPGPWYSEPVATLTPQMYPSHPGLIHTAPGQQGACAAGTCGGSAGCGSGALALCGAGCSGMGRNIFAGAGCAGGSSLG